MFGLKKRLKKLSSRLHRRYHEMYIKKNMHQSQSIVTHLTDEEKIILYKLVKGYKHHSPCTSIKILEVGSYLGASALVFSASAARHYASPSVYCVDTWGNEGMAEGLRDTWAEFHTNTAEYKNIIIPLRGKSEDVGNTWDRGPLDIIFLDGDHSYSGVLTDVKIWLQYLKPGGIIIMHDVGWAEGIQRVMREEIIPRTTCHTVKPNIFWGLWKG